MVSMGIRASKAEYQYVCLEADEDNLTLIDNGEPKCPNNTRGEQLSWLRKEIIELIKKHDVQIVAIKFEETNVRKPNRERGELEGVIQEAATSLGVPILNLRKQQLKAKLKFSSEARYIKREFSNSGLDQLVPAKYWESALAALAAHS